MTPIAAVWAVTAGLCLIAAAPRGFGPFGDDFHA